MKFSNFELVKTTGESFIDREFFAFVDVETGFLWWKKTERLEIRRTFVGFWHFVETGKHTPGGDIEALARSWTAKTGQET